MTRLVIKLYTTACGINKVGKLTTAINQQQTWCGHFHWMLDVVCQCAAPTVALAGLHQPVNRTISVGLALGSVGSLRGLSIVEMIHPGPFLNDPRGEVADTH